MATLWDGEVVSLCSTSTGCWDDALAGTGGPNDDMLTVPYSLSVSLADRANEDSSKVRDDALQIIDASYDDWHIADGGSGDPECASAASFRALWSLS